MFFVFERNCPIVVRLRFWSGTRRTGTCSTFTVIVAKGARVSLCTFSFLLSTERKSPCFLSTLTDFPLFLLLADVPVTVRSFLASKLRALTFWFRKISGSSSACPSEEHLGHTRQHCLELIRLANPQKKKKLSRRPSDGISWIDNRTSSDHVSKPSTSAPRKVTPIRPVKSRMDS